MFVQEVDYHSLLVLVLKEWSLTLRNNSGSQLRCAERELGKRTGKGKTFPSGFHDFYVTQAIP